MAPRVTIRVTILFGCLLALANGPAAASRNDPPARRAPLQEDATSQAAEASTQAPGPWRMLANPDAAGWSASGLDAAHALAEEIGSCAAMLVEDGVVVAAFGAIERPLDLHSVRKSVLSTLYGPAIEVGAVRLDATLDELGVDDLSPLSDVERSATVLHLLTSRSGVYLPAAKETPDAKRSRPERGTAAPGERFHYNNWDFNVAGVVLERATGRGIDALFRATLAEPLGMEDLDAESFAYELEPRQSRHPAYAIRLSARDLARFGALIAAGGELDGVALVPRSWIEESTRIASELRPGHGYGRMWWVYEPGTLESHPHLAEHRVIAGLGTGGQIVAVVPDAGLVFVHRGDTDNGRPVDGGKAWRLFDTLLAARTEAAESSDGGDPELAPLVARPLAGVLPPPELPAEWKLTPRLRDGLLGRYESRMGPPAELFLHDARLFVTVAHTFEGELVATANDELRAHHGKVKVVVERDDQGVATRLAVHAEGRVMRYDRVAAR